MNLSNAEKKEFIQIISELLETEQVLEMQNYMQHGNTTTFSHSLVVAYYSYLFALRLPLRCDIRSIVRGAMLHDFYLYDWHIPDNRHRLHGYVHAGFALKNAKKYFSLNPIEEDIIGKHMWPLNITKLPICKEAFLVNAIDKYCSLAETFSLPIMSKEYIRLLYRINNKKETSF